MFYGSLTPEEIRVIGALIEKEKTTPEYYPLSLNALVNACNQKSNRNPVVNYDEELVNKTIESLRDKKLVMRRTGDDLRVPKFRQTFTEFYNFDIPETAVLCTLFLRGAQTPGEIRTRCSRIYNFENLQTLDDTLKKLMDGEAQFIKKLPKQSGTKESRYVQLFCEENIVTNINDEEQDKELNSYSQKLETLEERVSVLENELGEVKKVIDLLTK